MEWTVTRMTFQNGVVDEEKGPRTIWNRWGTMKLNFSDTDHSPHSAVATTENRDRVRQRLNAAINAVCPADWRIGKWGDSSTVTLRPKPEATPEQIAAGNAAIAAFDWTDRESQDTTDLKAYLALTNPSSKQTADQVARLTAILLKQIGNN